MRERRRVVAEEVVKESWCRHRGERLVRMYI
jgi:hypothetical protein